MRKSGDVGINTALFDALPPARKVLELGCATGLLGARYKVEHPQAQWHGVDINEADLQAAAEVLDSAVARDLDTDAVATFGEGYDLVVMGDVLEHLKRPERLLSALPAICTPDATLAVCMPNLGHLTVIERMLCGDVMYDDAGLLDRTHLRIFTPRAFFKMLLDCSWLPEAAGRYRAEHANHAYRDALYAAARALGVSQEAAEYNIETYQLIVRGHRFDRAADSAGLQLAVVVNATNELEASLNIMRSPGLHELGATMLPLKGAASPAAALRFAAERTSAEWFLVAGEGVYFPKGSGHALARAAHGLAADVDVLSISAAGARSERTNAVLVRRGALDRLDGAATWDRPLTTLSRAGAASLAVPLWDPASY